MIILIIMYTRNSKTNRIIVYQPKIQVASKYERRVDTRSYDDKKKLFEGVSITFYNSKHFFCLISNTNFITTGMVLIDLINS